MSRACDLDVAEADMLGTFLVQYKEEFAAWISGFGVEEDGEEFLIAKEIQGKISKQYFLCIEGILRRRKEREAA
jgi:hypothetical protein